MCRALKDRYEPAPASSSCSCMREARALRSRAAGGGRGHQPKRTDHVGAQRFDQVAHIQLVGQAQQGGKLGLQRPEGAGGDQLGAVHKAQQERHLLGCEAVEGGLQHQRAVLQHRRQRAGCRNGGTRNGGSLRQPVSTGQQLPAGAPANTHGRQQDVRAEEALKTTSSCLQCSVHLGPQLGQHAAQHAGAHHEHLAAVGGKTS